VQTGKIKGSLTVNDIPKDQISQGKWSRLSSYVMQVRPLERDTTCVRLSCSAVLTHN
jgi:hypothetical protein